MVPANFERALRGFCIRQPFQPFYVELEHGRQFLVRHPEALAMRGRVAMLIREDGGYELFDGLSVCRLFDESAENLNLFDES